MTTGKSIEQAQIIIGITNYYKFRAMVSSRNEDILMARAILVKNILQSCEPNYDFTPHIYDVVDRVPDVTKDVLIDIFFLAHSER